MRIKLYIPDGALAYDDWTDGEKLFLSFMFFIYSKRECKVEYGYHMWLSDLSMILSEHNTSAIDVLNERLANLRRVFEIALVNNHCVRIRWKGTGKYEKRLLKKDTWITDPHVINQYYYLAGRCTDSDLIDRTTTEPYSYVVNGRDRVPPTKQHFHWKQRNLFKL